MAKKAERTLFKGWRPLAFLLIAAVAISFGLHLKSAANPGTESKQFASQPPLALDFYVSNTDMSLSVQLFIYQMKRSDSESVFVQAQIPNGETGYILMLSSMPDQDGQLHRLTPSPDAAILGHISQPYDSYYANVIKFSNATLTQPENNFSIETASFKSSKIIESTNASSYGHLPSIDALYQALPYQDIFPCILGELNASGDVSDMIIDPVGDSCVPDRKNSGAFYPARVSVAEILTGIAPIIKTEEVNYINPSGNIDGDSYVWQSDSDLEPIFEVTDQDAIQAESDDAFLAGVAFGVVGGAALAAVQELPGALNVRRRSRKPNSQDA